MNRILTSPFDLVAKVLDINVDQLTENSAMGETLNWDSLNHVAIIGELEVSYDVTIPNEEIENYVTMKAIISLYRKQSGHNRLKSLFQRIKEGFKKTQIGKIFYK
jgi:acyl carrier protein